MLHLVRRIGAAATGASLTAALRPWEGGWMHCKELTETPMLTPCRRGSYQISHCEKFEGRRGSETERAGVLRSVTTCRLKAAFLARRLHAAVAAGAAVAAVPGGCEAAQD